MLLHFGFFWERDYLFFLDFSHRVEIFQSFCHWNFTWSWFHIKFAAQDNLSNFHTVFFYSSSQISSSSNWFFQLFFKHIFVLCFVWIFFERKETCLLSNIFAFFFLQPNIAHQIVFFVYFISFKFLRDIQITTSHSARALFRSSFKFAFSSCLFSHFFS